MKTNTLTKYMMALAIAGSLWSCSKGSKSEDSVVIPSGPGVVTPDGTDPNTPVGGYGSGYDANKWANDGATAKFTPYSFATMNSWVGMHPLNNPKNYRIRVRMNKVYDYNSNGTVKAGPYYAGSVMIGYTDNGIWNESNLVVGNGKNINCSNCNNNNELEARYNYFYKQTNGQIVFSGFFQDQWGSIVVTLTPESGTGADAEGNTTWKGRVYYRNFAQSLNPQSPYRKCWFITDGPYRCDSVSVQNKTAIDPIVNYTYLGSFTGVKKNAILGL